MAPLEVPLQISSLSADYPFMSPGPNNASAARPNAGQDQHSVAAHLERVIAEYESGPRNARRLQRLAEHYPDLFFTAAAKHLESKAESRTELFLAALLVRQESFFERLTDPKRCSFESAVRLFKCLLTVDSTLDFRLARMLPGRNHATPSHVLTKGHTERALDILDRTPQGKRLFSAKAALFVGRRVENPAWTEKQLVSENDRLRANVLEASWGSASGAAVRLLGSCTGDKSNRVAGNALVGLHIARRPGVQEETIAMSMAEAPGRRVAAAWAMGKIGSLAFVDRLGVLLKDEAPSVRSMAIRSLAAIRRVEKQRLNSIPASAGDPAPAPVAAALPVALVEANVPEAPAVQRPDNSIFKLTS